MNSGVPLRGLDAGSRRVDRGPRPGELVQITAGEHACVRGELLAFSPDGARAFVRIPISPTRERILTVPATDIRGAELRG